jgi:hypothetical protein
MFTRYFFEESLNARCVTAGSPLWFAAKLAVAKRLVARARRVALHAVDILKNFMVVTIVLPSSG